MALVKYDTTLTYSTNTVELWNRDGNGELVDFAGTPKFTITRIDDPTKTYAVSPSATALGYVKYELDLGNALIKSLLKKDTDTTYDYDVNTFDHVYSVKTDGVGGETYMYGKLNLLEVA